jgi:hypothetical protein
VVSWDMALQELVLTKKWAAGTSKFLKVPDAFSRLCENKMDSAEERTTDLDRAEERTMVGSEVVSATLGAF